MMVEPHSMPVDTTTGSRSLKRRPKMAAQAYEQEAPIFYGKAHEEKGTAPDDGQNQDQSPFAKAHDSIDAGRFAGPHGDVIGVDGGASYFHGFGLHMIEN